MCGYSEVFPLIKSKFSGDVNTHKIHGDIAMETTEIDARWSTAATTQHIQLRWQKNSIFVMLLDEVLRSLLVML